MRKMAKMIFSFFLKFCIKVQKSSKEEIIRKMRKNCQTILQKIHRKTKVKISQ